MACSFNVAVAIRLPVQALCVTLGALLLPMTAVVSGQAPPPPRSVVLTPASVEQGQPVSVTGVSCSGAQSVLLDGSLFPAKPHPGDASTFEIATGSLVPRAYRVAMRCDQVSSQEVTLNVLPARAVPAPSVICVENRSPRDGVPPTLVAAREGKDPLAVNCAPQHVWTVRLEDFLAVRVSGYSDWIGDPANAARPLRVFVDGIELANVTVHRSASDSATNHDVLLMTVTFERDVTATGNRAAWAQLLRTARSRIWRGSHEALTFSIGPAGGPQWSTTAGMRLNPYPWGLTVFGVLVVSALVGLLIWAGVKTPLLRDSSAAKDAPFSLARSQMALWFVVVVGSYLFITVTTGHAAATSSTALILIGISGATGLIAVVMDRSKRVAHVNERRALEAEWTALTELLEPPGTGLKAQLAAAPPGSAEAAQLAATTQTRLERLAAVEQRLAARPRDQEPARSQGWLLDILSDENGISFHRLQMVVWTLVLVGTFITVVFRTFAMAEFDTATLGLMGISSGTYLGFKLPEPAVPAEGAIQ